MNEVIYNYLNNLKNRVEPFSGNNMLYYLEFLYEIDKCKKNKTKHLLARNNFSGNLCNGKDFNCSDFDLNDKGSFLGQLLLKKLSISERTYSNFHKKKIPFFLPLGCKTKISKINTYHVAILIINTELKYEDFIKNTKDLKKSNQDGKYLFMIDSSKLFLEK